MGAFKRHIFRDTKCRAILVARVLVSPFLAPKRVPVFGTKSGPENGTRLRSPAGPASMLHMDMLAVRLVALCVLLGRILLVHLRPFEL